VPSDGQEGLNSVLVKDQKIRTVLANCSVLHAPREMSPLLRELLRQGWRVVVILGWTGPSADDVENQFRAEGMDVVRPPTRFAYSTEESNSIAAPTWYRTRTVAPYVPQWLRLVKQTIGLYREMLEIKRWASAVFDDQKPIVFLSNNFHSSGRPDNALLGEAKRRGVLSACVLVSSLVAGVITRPGRLTQYGHGMSGKAIEVAHYGVLSRIVGWLKKDWTTSDGINTVFMWPLPQLLASKASGLTSDADIWQTPSPQFDAVFAPNGFSRNLLAESRYDIAKVYVLGAPRLDEAVEIMHSKEMERSLYEMLGLSLGQSYLLWNVEPSWEHGYAPQDVHWERIEKVVTILKECPIPVVVSLHPLCKYQNYEFLERDHGFVLRPTIGIHKLYPRAALVLTFPCSTNQYAEIFGKRLVLYDWFGAMRSKERRRLYLLSRMVYAESVDELRAVLGQELNVAAASHKTDSQLQAPQVASTAIVQKLNELLAGRPLISG
jgi:hypothetical protein